MPRRCPRLRACALFGLVLACRPEPAAQLSVAPQSSAAAQPPAHAGSAGAAALSASAGAAPTDVGTLTVQLARELDKPVTHVALDVEPHVAALIPGAVFVRDRRGEREEPLPPKLRSASNLALSVFFGRDYRVRVVGTHAGATGIESVYLRSLPGGLRAAPEEIGSLGSTRQGALVSLLGTADPELVCRPGDICLVKRLSGWTRLPAPADLSQVAIGSGQGFALAGKRVYRAERAWEPVGPEGAWEQPGALTVVGDRVFVLEPHQERIHRLVGERWEVLASPVGAPRGLWGATPDALWIVGSGGIAFYDGTHFRRVAQTPTDMYAVLGRNADDVWFGGASGLYRTLAVK